MIKYYDLGGDKQVNEIVMAGSHDAAITQGSSNAQTQNLDIYGQASAGVRIFDIRVTGAVVSGRLNAGPNRVELRAYHGSDVKLGGVSTVKEVRTGAVGPMHVKPMVLGTYGMTLSSILSDARQFVGDNSSEFLILKFDKCQNWRQIAEACRDILGDTICTLRGNLNTKTLRELRGQVIVLFSTTGQAAVGWLDPAQIGILAFQNLASDAGAFDPQFDGLQYYGKGGTQAFAFWRTKTGKMKENIKKQRKLMNRGAAVDPNIMGMMYWTTTGLTHSIKTRNKFMWSDDNAERLVDFLNGRVPSSINTTQASSGAVLKTFMPNFVMIDFASTNKCNRIYDMNAVPSMSLTDSVSDFGSDEDEASG